MLKTLFTLLLSILFIPAISLTNINAQNVSVSGANVGNGSYATLGAAFTAINSGSQTGASISILITANTTETVTAQLNSGSWNSFSITITSGGNKTISGNISGNALIRFDGADNVNINGFNSGSYLKFDNSSTSATAFTCTLLFINDASNNRVSNCLIEGVSANANIIFSTGISTGNDNNSIFGCNIGSNSVANTPTCAVQFGNTSIPNNGDTISNCLIYNFFSATAFSAGIRIGAGNSDITIYKNRFFQTTARTITAAVTHYVIWIENPSTYNCRIIENTIGRNAPSSGFGNYTVTGGNVSSRFLIIYANGGSTSIQGNIITAITTGGSMTGTFAATPFTFIYINAGTANIGNESGNFLGTYFFEDSTYFSNNSSSETHIFGIYMPGGVVSDYNTSNNTFGRIRVNNFSSGAIGIFVMRFVNTRTWICQNNVIGGTNANSIINTTTAAGSFITGIINNLGTGTCNISGNTIRNLTTAGGTGTGTSASLTGIIINNPGSSNTVYKNEIYNLKNTNTTAACIVNGIYFSGADTGSNSISSNFIHNLSISGNNSSINGIYTNAGKSTFDNNMISIGLDQSGSSIVNGSTLNGIRDFSGINNYYFNSVYMGGSPTSGAGNTYAFYSSVITNTRNFRNNIFFNARSNSGSTGKHYSVRVGGTAPNPAGLTLNNNIYLANGTGGVFGFFNVGDVVNLSSWKTAVGQDANSFESNPQFITPAGTSSTTNMHINPYIQTDVEGNGSNIPAVLNDYDGELRVNLTPVDIGADAGIFNLKTLNLTMLIQGFYDAGTNTMVQDTARVYLRNSASPYAIVDSAIAYLSNTGAGALNFSNVSNGVNYYIQLKHRNSIETWSSSTPAFVSNTMTYDLTTAAAQAYGDNQSQVNSSPVKFAIYNGDLNQDGTIDAGDLSQVENDASNSLSGYVQSDVTGDDFVDAGDLSIVENNSALGVSAITP